MWTSIIPQKFGNEWPKWLVSSWNWLISVLPLNLNLIRIRYVPWKMSDKMAIQQFAIFCYLCIFHVLKNNQYLFNIFGIRNYYLTLQHFLCRRVMEKLCLPYLNSRPCSWTWKSWNHCTKKAEEFGLKIENWKFWKIVDKRSLLLFWSLSHLMSMEYVYCWFLAIWFFHMNFRSLCQQEYVYTCRDCRVEGYQSSSPGMIFFFPFLSLGGDVICQSILLSCKPLLEGFY